MKYNESDVQRIARELNSAFNVKSRNGKQTLKASIDCVVWDIAEGKMQIEDAYDTIYADLNFASNYFDGQCANIANRAVEKIKAIA